MPKQKIIIISGPTASGKTEISLSLAKKLNTYIISADSRQVYKKMNIGTAKPAGQHRAVNNDNMGVDALNRDDKQDKIKITTDAYYIDNIPHFLIDHVNPDTNYTLADWQTEAEELLDSKKLKNDFKIPMIVGGTGLYINSLTDDYSLPTGNIDEQLRHFLSEQPLEKLQEQLKNKSLETYEYIDLDNKRRVVRALEYIMTNNKPFLPEQKNQAEKYDIVHLSINIDRDELYNRINKRVDDMIAQGLVTEVENLLKKYDKNLPSLSGIGYAEIIDYLDNKIDLPTAVEKIQQHTRNYAKRQLTWFKRDNKIVWVKNLDEAEKKINKFLNN